MSRQVDVASGGLCERKEFLRRILPLRSAKRLLERAPSIYYGLGYAVLLGIVHRMLPWRRAKQARDSTVTFLNTTDCRTGRRARQPRPAQILTSLALFWCIAHRLGGIPAFVGGRLPICGLLDNLWKGGARRAAVAQGSPPVALSFATHTFVMITIEHYAQFQTDQYVCSEPMSTYLSMLRDSDGRDWRHHDVRLDGAATKHGAQSHIRRFFPRGHCYVTSATCSSCLATA